MSGGVLLPYASPPVAAAAAAAPPRYALPGARVLPPLFLPISAAGRIFLGVPSRCIACCCTCIFRAAPYVAPRRAYSRGANSAPARLLALYCAAAAAVPVPVWRALCAARSSSSPKLPRRRAAPPAGAAAGAALPCRLPRLIYMLYAACRAYICMSSSSIFPISTRLLT